MGARFRPRWMLAAFVATATLLGWRLSAYGVDVKLPPLKAEGPWGSQVRFEVSDRLRGEFVDWFETAPDSPVKNFRHDFLANRFQAGLRVTRDPYEMFIQLQHTLLENVPENAPGPGGVYFANTRSRFQQEPILRAGWFRAKQLLGVKGLSGTLGRQIYRDGLEAPARDQNLQWVKQVRIAERLIGPFDYTHIGRSFDGGVGVYDNELLNVTGFVFVPTAGGFEISASREADDIKLGGLALTVKDSPRFPGSDARLFWIFYDDDREIVFLDNRPLAARQADSGGAQLQTFGAHLAHVRPTGPGKLDLLVWGVGQGGEWQSLDHAGWAYAFEAGYQFPNLWAAPWLRGGIDRASGDSDPGDGTHETFFQLLPTPRIYAQFPFYNLMNNQDVFLQLILKPLGILGVRMDLHWLRTTEGSDFLYSGGGATKNDFFGYAGVPANAHHEIGYLTDIAFTFKPADPLTVYAYYAHVFGQGVIDRAFRGRDANYGYLETTLAF